MTKHIWWQAPIMTLVFLIISWLFYVPGFVIFSLITKMDVNEKGLVFLLNYWPLLVLALILFVVILIRVALEHHLNLFALAKKKWWKLLLVVFGINVVMLLFICLIPYVMSMIVGIPANPMDPVYFENSCSDYRDCVIIHKEHGCCECQYGAYSQRVVELRQKWNDIWYRHKCTGAVCEQMLCPDLTSRTVDCVDGYCEIFYAGAS